MQGNIMKSLFAILLLLLPFSANASNWYIDRYSPFTATTIAGEECRYLRVTYADPVSSYSPGIDSTAITNARFVYTKLDSTGTGANITLKSCTDGTNTATCTDMIADISGTGSPVPAALTADADFLATTTQYIRAQVNVAATGSGTSILEVCGSNQVGPIVEVDPIFKQMNSLAALEAQIQESIPLGTASIIAGTNITIDPPSGIGNVIVNASGGATNLSTTRTASAVVIASSTGTNATINSATTSVAGALSAADKVILDNLAGNNVTSILAGANVTISPPSGLGDVTINSTGGGSTASTTTFSPITGNSATEVQSAIANLQSTKADTSSQAAVLVSGQGSPAITTTINPNDLNNDNTINDTLPCTSTTCFFQGSDGSMWHKTRTSGNNQWSRLDSSYNISVPWIGGSTAADVVAYDGTNCLNPQNTFLGTGAAMLACTTRYTSHSFAKDTVITGMRFFNEAFPNGNLLGTRGCDFGFSSDGGATVAAGRTVSMPKDNVSPQPTGTVVNVLADPIYLASGEYHLKVRRGSFCDLGNGATDTTPSTNCLCDGNYGWGDIRFDGYEIQ